MRIGKIQWHLDSTYSTNDFIRKRLAEEKLKSGEIAFTDGQTKGRGQRGKKWISEKGKNLLLSYYLEWENGKPETPFSLTENVSLMAREFLQNYLDREVVIKWPNDLLVDGKKIAGILIENQWSSSWTSSIIGLGININQTQWQEDMDRKPTSLAVENNRDYVLSDLKNSFVAHCNEWPIPKDLKKSYSEHLLGFGQSVEVLFLKNNRRTYARIADIKNSGEILLDYEDQQKWVSHGEIKFL